MKSRKLRDVTRVMLIEETYEMRKVRASAQRLLDVCSRRSNRRLSGR